MSIDPAPHAPYIAAVAAAAGIDTPHTPSTPRHFVAYPEAHGLLTASLHYRQEGGGSEALPDGVTLWWDQRAGWRYVPGGRPNAQETALPIPILATPDAIVGLLPDLLAGRTGGLARSADQWPLTQTRRRLLGRLDVIEQLEADGWEHRGEPDEPVVLACGSVVWRLTDDHEDFWYGGDWRDSRLSGLLWHTPYAVSVPGDVIVAAARAAVVAARQPVSA
ncbi:hypothetical protein [Streptomyces sp. NPDC050428]|uniref:hypothetical protein n=1 Tax=Streptomyces sp. NPDC050428 TaxID=3155757 RepID=UPI00341AF0CD